MLGVDENDPVLADNALALMQKPSDKWHAAVWAHKRLYPATPWDRWSVELGEADTQATENDSVEAFNICLAKLDLELFNNRTLPRGERSRTELDTLVHTAQTLLLDEASFTEIYTCPNDYRLQLASMLRRGGDFSRAAQVRKQIDRASEDSVRDYDAQTPLYRGAMLKVGGLITRTRQGKNPFKTGQPESTLMWPIRKVDEAVWDFDPKKITASSYVGQAGVNQENSHLIDSLDALLRAGENHRAANLFTDITAHDTRRGGFSECHRGVQIQAAALLVEAGQQDIIDKVAANAQAHLSLLEGSPSSHAHLDAAERSIASMSLKDRVGYVMNLANRVADFAERTRILAALHTFQDSRTLLGKNSEAVQLLEHRLFRAAYTWLEQVPGDPRLEAFMRDDSAASHIVRLKFEAHIDAERRIFREGLMYIGSIAAKELLHRTGEGPDSIES